MKLQLKMQSLLLMVILPVLISMSVITGYLIYSELYRIILNGFESKLASVSTVVSSFIDGDEHKKAMNTMQYRGAAYDERRGILYLNHFTGMRIVEYNTLTGRASLSREFNDGWFEDMAYDSERNRLVAGALEPQALFAVDLNRNQSAKLTDLDEPCYGMAYIAGRDKYICNTDTHLVQIDPVDFKTKKLAALDATAVRGLAYNRSEEQLYGIDTRDNTFLSISLIDGSTEKFGILKKNTDVEYRNDFVFGAFGLAVDSRTGRFFAATTVPVIEFSPENLKAEEVLKGVGENREYLAIHEKYMVPMVYTRIEAGLTYLFSAALLNRARELMYMIDSTQDEIHSFNGFIDPDEAEDNLRDVWLKGELFFSDISYWEEWGLLKSAYVPVYNSDDEITGIVTSDVNISVIETKTRDALLQVLFSGFVAVIVGILVSFFIARRLTRPIYSMKAAALKVAAGDYSRRINVEKPVELNRLADEFNRVSESLEVSLDRIQTDNEKLEIQRRDKEIIRALSSGMAAELNLRSGRLTARWPGDTNISHYADGILFIHDYTVIWFSAEYPDKREAVTAREEILELFRASAPAGAPDKELIEQIAAERSLESVLITAGNLKNADIINQTPVYCSDKETLPADTASADMKYILPPGADVSDISNADKNRMYIEVNHESA